VLFRLHKSCHSLRKGKQKEAETAILSAEQSLKQENKPMTPQLF
jgi:hypothetical protein